MKKFLLILLFTFVLSQARRAVTPSPTPTDETETEKKTILQKLGDFVHKLIEKPKAIYDTLLGEGSWEKLVNDVVDKGKTTGTEICVKIINEQQDCERFIDNLADEIIGVLS